MDVLLDSHTLIWGIDTPSRLSPVASATLQDRKNLLFVSMATFWEISIKVGLKRLPLSLPFHQWRDTAIAALDLAVIPISHDHISLISILPRHHKDPFDRMLIAQSLVMKLPIVGSDIKFDSYGVTRIWN